MEDCMRAGGLWGRCDRAECEILGERGLQSVPTWIPYEIGVWGAYFQDEFGDPQCSLTPNAFDPTLVDPCMHWAILYDQDPQVCEGGIPENPSNPNGSGSHVDVCDDPDEVNCAFCNLRFTVCLGVAASNGIFNAPGCVQTWRTCIKRRCGIHCDY
jgi:hypothetical protein